MLENLFFESLKLIIYRVVLIYAGIVSFVTDFLVLYQLGFRYFEPSYIFTALITQSHLEPNVFNAINLGAMAPRYFDADHKSESDNQFRPSFDVIYISADFHYAEPKEDISTEFNSLNKFDALKKCAAFIIDTNSGTVGSLPLQGQSRRLK